MMSLEQYKRQHRRYERQLASVIASTFTGQAARVAAELALYDTITADTIDHVFRVDDEHVRFMAAIRTPLSSIMADSAYREWKRLHPQKPTTGKAWGTELVSGLWDKLPRRFLRFIRLALDELEAQEYWQEIQAATSKRLTSLVRTGLADGETTRNIAKSIQKWLGGPESKARALAIARTEVSGSMNAGHYATHQGLAEQGVIVARVWSAVRDKDTRYTHTEADGQVAKNGANFIIGGYEARYPGDVNLPAAERVRCRCLATGRID